MFCYTHKSCTVELHCQYLGDSWEDYETVFNVMTTSVLETDGDMLNIDKIGTELYDTFIEERKTDSEISVWDTIKNNNNWSLFVQMPK